MLNRKGFTLIELLVVVAIMAILFVGVVVMLNPLQRMQEARDSKRIQSIQSLRTAVDLALTDGEITLNGPAATGNSKAGTLATDGSGWVKITTVTNKTGLVKYLPILPNDPQGATAPGSGLEWVSNGTAYEIKCTFETTKYTTDYAAVDGGNEAGKYEVGTSAGLAL